MPELKLNITQQIKDDAEYLEIISKQLNDKLFYHYTSLYRLNNNGYKPTSAKRLLALDINIPKRFITSDDKIQIGDLILTEVDKETYEKIQVDKFTKKLHKTIELTRKILPWWKNTIDIPDNIYDRVLVNFKDIQLPNNLIIRKI